MECGGHLGQGAPDVQLAQKSQTAYVQHAFPFTSTRLNNIRQKASLYLNGSASHTERHIVHSSAPRERFP